MHEGLDIIGDVHGYVQDLGKLLEKLGYKFLEGYYRHPARQAIFLGDLIDRGPENFATLRLVKMMVTRGAAKITMGNHELNALAYHIRNREGEYLRPHTKKNREQHKTVLAEIAGEKGREWQHYLEWFREMPLFIEIQGIRVVHACWDKGAIALLRENQNEMRDKQGRLTDDFIKKATTPGNPFFDAVEILLKGKEVWLPQGHPGIPDKDGNLRRKVRIKWWLTKTERMKIKTYDTAVRAEPKTLKYLSNLTVPATILKDIQQDDNCIPEEGNPLFVGHYWFTGTPRLLTSNVACLDYSIARGGKLVCYRWDGEQKLDPSKFTWV